jgi:hypothetical protein
VWLPEGLLPPRQYPLKATKEGDIARGGYLQRPCVDGLDYPPEGSRGLGQGRSVRRSTSRHPISLCHRDQRVRDGDAIDLGRGGRGLFAESLSR